LFRLTGCGWGGGGGVWGQQEISRKENPKSKKGAIQKKKIIKCSGGEKRKQAKTLGGPGLQHNKQKEKKRTPESTDQTKKKRGQKTLVFPGGESRASKEAGTGTKKKSQVVKQ